VDARYKRGHDDSTYRHPAPVPPISSSYSGCGNLMKELEIEKRH